MKAPDLHPLVERFTSTPLALSFFFSPQTAPSLSHSSSNLWLSGCVSKTRPLAWGTFSSCQSKPLPKPRLDPLPRKTQQQALSPSYVFSHWTGPPAAIVSLSPLPVDCLGINHYDYSLPPISSRSLPVMLTRNCPLSQYSLL